MSWLYNSIYLLAIILATPWLAIRSLRTGRYRDGWLEKLFGFVPQLDSQPTLWLHGVSVGEIQLLRPIAEQLQLRFPDHRIVISTTTVTGMRLARQLFPTQIVFYFPLDFSWAVGQALRRIRPHMIVLGELEIWPNLIAQASQQRVPVAIINGRLSERSFCRYSRFNWLLRPTFGRLRLVLAQNETYAQRFRELGVPATCVRVSGSTKFDNVNLERSSSQVSRLKELVGLTPQHRVIVLGSSQDPEESHVLQAFGQLVAEQPALRLIVVPRHAERFESVFQLLYKSQLRVARRSEIHTSIPASDWQIILVDTIGELRWWWGLAEIAVVGGSFGSRGGQNMLEPSAYGCNVSFGPHTWNFREIVNSLVEHEAVSVLEKLTDLHSWLRNELENPEPGRQRGERARAAILRHQGASDRTIDQLECLLRESNINSSRIAA